MTLPQPPTAQQKGMVRALLVAIAIMTLAIIVLFAAIVARLLSPRVEEETTAAPARAEVIDFAQAPVVRVVLPAGARIVETHVSAGRASFVVETADGGRAVYTAPLDGFDEPARLELAAPE